MAAALCLAVAGCGSTSKVSGNKFDPKKYGVSGSPRVVSKGKTVPKGGGRYVIGKPYKIAGRWYRPKLDPDYDKVGLASWYGSTFHGRMTANGEIFDKGALTAAHPTMPLPSYARVTNLANDRSITVRVNDRGPFHGHRVIDLSSRVADMLDFKDNGTAKVRVQYVGRARMDGRDEKYLLASYRGPGAVTPGGTMPGTMLASAEPPAMVVGPAPLPRERPIMGARNPIVLAAFDPAKSYADATAPVSVAANSGPFGTGARFTPPSQNGNGAASRTQAAYAPRIQGGEQTMMSFKPVVYHPAAGKPAYLPPVPASLKRSYTATRRIDDAYRVFDAIGGGVAPAQLVKIAHARR